MVVSYRSTIDLDYYVAWIIHDCSQIFNNIIIHDNLYNYYSTCVWSSLLSWQFVHNVSKPQKMKVLVRIWYMLHSVKCTHLSLSFPSVCNPRGYFRFHWQRSFWGIRGNQFSQFCIYFQYRKLTEILYELIISLPKSMSL